MSKLGVTGNCSNVAMGLVNGVCTEVLIDSGAELGSVPRALVPVNAQMCGEVIMKGSVGKEQMCESFMADFVVGGFYKRVRAIVDDDSHQGAACIVPFCVTDTQEYEAFASAIDEYHATDRAELMAIDLVGPLPKGKGGSRFLLTYVCLDTRWPEAVPLRSVSAKSVVEGLWSIFSQTAILERILSDQGSQFCGKVIQQFSNWLGIEKVKISPYHPESNGCVERLHGTLKAILGKGMSEGLDWVGQVNFALFVLRQMPHADSGYSPFDLVYWFRVRTPLDALYHGLFEAEESNLNVCEWVSKMAERLESVRDSAALGMAK